MKGLDETKQPPSKGARAASRMKAKRRGTVESPQRTPCRTRRAAAGCNAAAWRTATRWRALFFPKRRGFAQLFCSGGKAVAADHDFMREPAIDQALRPRRQGQFGGQVTGD